MITDGLQDVFLQAVLGLLKAISCQSLGLGIGLGIGLRRSRGRGQRADWLLGSHLRSKLRRCLLWLRLELAHLNLWLQIDWRLDERLGRRPRIRLTLRLRETLKSGLV